MPNLGLTWDSTSLEPKTAKSVKHLQSKLKKKSVHIFIDGYLFFDLCHSYLARLALQELYFEKLHNIAPYFVLICFDRLKSVYITLLQLKYEKNLCQA